MNFRSIPRLALFSAAALLAAAAAASADPPGRIGRLSYMEGTVSLHVPGQDQWSAAAINYPVTSGYGLWTEPDGRAEIEIGGAGLRLDHSTEAEVLKLDDASTELRIDQGVVNVHVTALPPGGITVVTPVGQVSLQAPGSYDIDAGQPNGDTPSGQARVTVLEGQARIAGPRAALEIGHSEAAIVTGDPPTFQLVEGDATDFDNWSLAREQRESPRAALTYVAPEMTGYQDLDTYGQWSRDPGYGAVWYPTAVPADWAPYRYGHWVWIAPWGWTWVDAAPWGFAPFHYGRWAYIHDRWGWAPGVFVARPVYAPALVVFIGIGLSAGPSVGWVPLAPGERFHPYYRASDRYARNVNVTNVTNINNVTINNNATTVNNFRNARAATVVPQAAFAHAAPVQRAAVKVPQAQLVAARVTANPGNVQPTREARGAVAHPEAVQANAAANAKPERPAAAPPVQPNARSGPGARPGAAAPPPAAAGAPVRPEAQGHAAPPAHPEAQPHPQPGAQPPAHPEAQPHPQAAAPQPPARSAAPPHPQAAVPQAAVPQPPARSAAPPHPQAAVPQPPVRPEAQRPTPTPQPPTRPEAHVQPGPPIPRQAVVAPRPLPAYLPPAPVEHPAQQTHLAPTPQGWQRVAPAPPPRQPAPQPAHAAAPAPRPAPPAQHAAPTKPAPPAAHAAPPAKTPPDHPNDPHP